MCPDCQHERLWNLVLWGVDGGCAHRAHRHHGSDHASVKCAQCALVCKPQFADEEHLRTERNYGEGAEEEDGDEGEGREPREEA